MNWWIAFPFEELNKFIVQVWLLLLLLLALSHRLIYSSLIIILIFIYILQSNIKHAKWGIIFTWDPVLISLKRSIIIIITHNRTLLHIFSYRKNTSSSLNSPIISINSLNSRTQLKPKPFQWITLFALKFSESSWAQVLTTCLPAAAACWWGRPKHKLFNWYHTSSLITHRFQW